MKRFYLYWWWYQGGEWKKLGVPFSGRWQVLYRIVNGEGALYKEIARQDYERWKYWGFLERNRPERLKFRVPSWFLEKYREAINNNQPM